METAIYVVATPIGNLADITLRALDVLRGVDLIAAEDTRHSRRLLDHYGISTKLVPYHEHNEKDKAGMLIDWVRQGKSVALISDAGTPLISDPGHVLIRQASLEGVSVVPLPGPSALIAALSASGLPCGRFIFEGFLPAKQKAKRELLESFFAENRTVVFYESPHRIIDTLEVLADIFPERRIAIARELTKRYETIYSASARDVAEWAKEDADRQKGEFVLILAGSEVQVSAGFQEQEALLKKLLDYLPPKKSAQIVAEHYNGNKKQLYEVAVSYKNETL